MVHGAPKVVPLTVDLHENLVKLPLPMARSQPLDPAHLDLIGEHRAEPVPPKSNSFVADLDAPFMQKILNVSQLKREPHIEHDSQADDLGARFEVLERRAFGHARTLPGALPRLKQSSSDKTLGPLHQVEVIGDLGIDRNKNLQTSHPPETLNPLLIP